MKYLQPFYFLQNSGKEFDFFLRERCGIIKSFRKLYPGIQIIFGNICKKYRTKFGMIREFPNINKAEWRMKNKTCSSGRICRKGRKNADNGTKRSFI
ncbi:hypothetical protein DW672_09710 [[Ruminococcus] lactaris]|uniref:Uncharacterized protein n=1 Tax=[Ruminococcus] lactaris TaxID=46228 RepID=A0A414P2T9_9FIRM|nr:hypothetical protein DW672_09710 [[Ruminococcus] lactaris]